MRTSLLALSLSLVAGSMNVASGAPPSHFLARGSNAFAFDLYQRLRPQKGNLVFSPASVTIALAMSWGGAKGETSEQMQKVLHFEGTPAEVMDASGQMAAALQDPKRPIVFRIANRLFGEKTYSLETAYLEATKRAYGSTLELVDFKRAPDPSRLRINGWVEEQTKQRIKNLVPPPCIDDQTRLVLVNAIYFLGDWQDPFKKELTAPWPFRVTKREKKDVPTMHTTNSFGFVAKNGLKAVELPYQGGDLSMLVVLPDQIEALGAVEKSLTPQKLDELVKSLQPTEVAVSLPKFEINPSGALRLAHELKELGMSAPFDRHKADFTGIANPANADDRLFIGEVIHKAFIRVDEKGTEAAAATAVVMNLAGGFQLATEFSADHPFLFFIRDRATGLIIFMGRVADPSAKS